MITEEQRRERINYIGGSDAPAVLGVSRWKTALQVWGEKTGLITPPDISEKIQIRLGNKLEQAVAELFMEETGMKLQRVNETVYHKKHKFIAANLDRKVVGHYALVEVKTTDARNADEWEDGQAPADAIAQVLHQLAVTGLEKGYVVGLIGNRDLKIVEVPRNEAAIKELIATEVDFWNNFVVPKVMPAVGSMDKDTLLSLFPQGREGEPVVLDDVAASTCELLESMDADYKALGLQIEKARNELRAQMKDSETAVAGAYKLYWTNVTRSRLDTEKMKEEAPEVYARFAKPTTSRRFLMKKLQQDQLKEESNG